jgi:hypothetical protein
VALRRQALLRRNRSEGLECERPELLALVRNALREELGGLHQSSHACNAKGWQKRDDDGTSAALSQLSGAAVASHDDAAAPSVERNARRCGHVVPTPKSADPFSAVFRAARA